MSLLDQPALLAQLESFSRQLETSFAMHTVSYSPLQEAKYADSIDLYCQLMTQGAHPSRSNGSGGAPSSLTPLLAKLIVCRIRDAQRYVRSAAFAEVLGTVVASTIHRQLLVDWWHDYAEPYWRERFERYAPPTVPILRETAAHV